MLIFRKRRYFVCLSILPRQVNKWQGGNKHTDKVNLFKQAIWILCKMSNSKEKRKNDTWGILSHLNRSDSCLIMARIWQLHRSPQEIKRGTRTIWFSLSLWHPISLSHCDRNPPSRSVLLSLTHSVGIYCDFRAKEHFWRAASTEGALPLKSHLLRASERLSNLVLTLHQTKTIFRRHCA